ncbi:hypothetical protein J6590_106376, partial [Homalodisca vitripennis]
KYSDVSSGLGLYYIDLLRQPGTGATTCVEYNKEHEQKQVVQRSTLTCQVIWVFTISISSGNLALALPPVWILTRNINSNKLYSDVSSSLGLYYIDLFRQPGTGATTCVEYNKEHEQKQVVQRSTLTCQVIWVFTISISSGNLALALPPVWNITRNTNRNKLYSEVHWRVKWSGFVLYRSVQTTWHWRYHLCGF